MFNCQKLRDLRFKIYDSRIHKSSIINRKSLGIIEIPVLLAIVALIAVSAVLFATATPPAVTPINATNCVDNNPGTVKFTWTKGPAGLHYELWWDGSGGTIDVGDVGEKVQPDFSVEASARTIIWNVRAFDPASPDTAGPTAIGQVTITPTCGPPPTQPPPTLPQTPAPPANRKPQDIGAIQAPGTGVVNQLISLSAASSDPDGDKIKVLFEITSSQTGTQRQTTPLSANGCSSPCTLTYSFTPAIADTYQIRALAIDQNDLPAQNYSPIKTINVSQTASGSTPTNLSASAPTPCATGPYTATLNWNNSGGNWKIDVSHESNFASYSQKNIPSVTTTAALAGFIPLVGPNAPTILNPDTPYYWRIWNGATYTNAPASFSSPSCVAPNRAPSVPSTPTGPATGQTGQTYNYSSTATDPDGDSLYLKFVFRKQTGGDVFVQSAAGASGSNFEVGYIFPAPGTYYVAASSVDSKGLASLAWSAYLLVTITNQIPNRAPDIASVPQGRTTGKAGDTLTYTSSTKDPDDDHTKIIFQFEKPDGSIDQKTSPISASRCKINACFGETSYTFTQDGNYKVKAMSMDERGQGALLSAPLTVTITTPLTLPSNLRVSNLPNCASGSYSADLLWENSGANWVVDVSADPGYNSFSNKSVANITSTSIPESLSPGLTLTPGQKYYWRIFFGRVNTWSTGPEFSVPACALPKPGAFSLVSPANNATDVSGNPTFDWQDSTNAANYGIYIASPTATDWEWYRETNGTTSQVGYNNGAGWDKLPAAKTNALSTLTPGVWRYLVQAFNADNSQSTYANETFQFQVVSQTPPVIAIKINAKCNIQGDSGFDITQGQTATITVPNNLLKGTGGPWAPAVRFVNPLNASGERRKAVGPFADNINNRVRIGPGLTLGANPESFNLPHSGDLVFTFYADNDARVSDYKISNLLLVYAPTNDPDQDANCTGILDINVKAKPTSPPKPAPAPKPQPAPLAYGVTITGHYIDQDGNNFENPNLNAVIHQDTRLGIPLEKESSQKPTFQFKEIPEGTYSILAKEIPSLTTSYALCINSSCSSSQQFTNGNVAFASLPDTGNFADIYFKYIKASTPKPQPPGNPSVTNSQCVSAGNANITFNWTHKTATKFKIGWRVKSEPKVTNFFTADAFPLIDQATGQAVDGYWTLTYPGFTPGVELAGWQVIALENNQESEPASSGGTVTATSPCDGGAGGQPIADNSLAPPDDLRADTDQPCALSGGANVKFAWHDEQSEEFILRWKANPNDQWEAIRPDAKQEVVFRWGSFPLKYWRVTYPGQTSQSGFQTAGKPISSWQVIGIKGGKQSQPADGESFTPKDCQRIPTVDPAIEQPTRLKADTNIDCAGPNSANVKFRWHQTTTRTFKIGWKVNPSDNPEFINATTAQEDDNPLPGPTGDWTFIFPGDSGLQGFANAGRPLADWQVIAVEGDKQSVAASGGQFTPKDCAQAPDIQVAPDDPKVTGTSCVEENNADVTFRWHQKTSTAQKFQIGWTTALDQQIEWFTPPDINQERNALFVPTGYWNVTYPGFNTYREPILLWGVKAVYGPNLTSEPAYGKEFIPQDCSTGAPSHNAVVDCCQSPTYPVNEKTLGTIDDLKTFSSQSLDEVQSELRISLSGPSGGGRGAGAKFLLTNTLQLLKSLNYVNPALLLRNSSRQQKAAVQIATFSRLYTLSAEGNSIAAINNFYRKFTNGAGIINEEGLKYLDTLIFNGELEKYLHCKYGDGGKLPYEINPNCTPPVGIDISPLLDSHQTLHDISLGGGKITDFVNFTNRDMQDKTYWEQATLSAIGNRNNDFGKTVTSLETVDNTTREFLDPDEAVAQTYFNLGKYLEGASDSVALNVMTYVADHYKNTSIASSARNEADHLTSITHTLSVMRYELIIGIAALDNFFPWGKAFKLARAGAMAPEVAHTAPEIERLGRIAAHNSAVLTNAEGKRFTELVLKDSKNGATPAEKSELGGLIAKAAGTVIKLPKKVVDAITVKYTADSGFGKMLGEHGETVARLTNGDYKIVVDADDPILRAFAQKAKGIKDPVERIKILKDEVQKIPDADLDQALAAKGEIPISHFIENGAICAEKAMLVKASMEILALSEGTDAKVRIVSNTNSEITPQGCSIGHGWVEMLATQTGKRYFVDPTKNYKVLELVNPETKLADPEGFYRYYFIKRPTVVKDFTGAAAKIFESPTLRYTQKSLAIFASDVQSRKLIESVLSESADTENIWQQIKSHLNITNDIEDINIDYINSGKYKNAYKVTTDATSGNKSFVIKTPQPGQLIDPKEWEILNKLGPKGITQKVYTNAPITRTTDSGQSIVLVEEFLPGDSTLVAINKIPGPATDKAKNPIYKSLGTLDGKLFKETVSPADAYGTRNAFFLDDNHFSNSVSYPIGNGKWESKYLDVGGSFERDFDQGLALNLRYLNDIRGRLPRIPNVYTYIEGYWPHLVKGVGSKEEAKKILTRAADQLQNNAANVVTPYTQKEIDYYAKASEDIKYFLRVQSLD